jgi:hypothetical protein
MRGGVALSIVNLGWCVAWRRFYCTAEGEIANPLGEHWQIEYQCRPIHEQTKIPAGLSTVYPHSLPDISTVASRRICFCD